MPEPHREDPHTPSTAATPEMPEENTRGSAAEGGAFTMTRTTTDPIPASPLHIGAVHLELPGGSFVFDSPTPMVSSDRKRAYRGTYVRPDGMHLSAIAIVFTTPDVSFYAAEVASLARNRLLCVGPSSYESFGTAYLDSTAYPAVVEEDAGANLEDVLFRGKPIPGESKDENAPLHPVGSRERALENGKIFYDILDQAERLHAHGLYHRDIRAANVCVRRFGVRPSDIHATLIDYELLTSYEGTEVPASARRYSRSLFEDIPRRAYGDAAVAAPTSLIRDVGYLAALRFELETGRGVECALPENLRFGARPFFQYSENGKPLVRRIDREQDLEPLANELGLEPLDENGEFDAQTVAYALDHIAPGGYLDERARLMIDRDTSFLRQAPLDELAREIAYRSWAEACRKAGRTPEYESFEQQPQLLQDSNVDQIRDIPAKLHALGYRMAPLGEVPEAERVTRFNPEEIEALAYLEHRRWCEERIRHGWIAGSPRDDERRIHPDLIPFDELPEQSKEYDRTAAKTILDILERAGYAVTR